MQEMSGIIKIYSVKIAAISDSLHSLDSARPISAKDHAFEANWQEAGFCGCRNRPMIMMMIMMMMMTMMMRMRMMKMKLI